MSEAKPRDVFDIVGDQAKAEIERRAKAEPEPRLEKLPDA